MEENSAVVALDHNDEGTHVSAKIGEEYKAWKKGDIVLISAPTGSGKSYFILHVLLEHVIDKFIEQKEYHPIYYFVNRKILQKQLLEELYHKIQPSLRRKMGSLNVEDFITIETYQSVESQCKDSKTFSLHRELTYGRPGRVYEPDYAYTVYDECHYFLSDSLYNSATQLSFDCLTHVSDQNIQIFMSATIKDIKMVIRDRYSIENVNAPHAYNNLQDTYHGFHMNAWSIRDYPISETNFQNICIHGLDDVDSIGSLILDNIRKGKWLIFVDSIKYGKELYKNLSKEESLEDEVIFIDAEYEKDPEAAESVDEVVKKKYIGKKVVICTSVLDNGVSFHDEGLRNVIILTDTEEEFIQMLGRKRFDNKSIDLYIVKRNRKFFTDRLNYVKKTLDILLAYKDRIAQLANPVGTMKKLSQAISVLGSANQDYYTITNEITTYLNNLYSGIDPNVNLIEINNKVTTLTNKHVWSFSNLIEKWNSFLLAEKEYGHRRQEFSNLLFTSEYLYNHIRRFCYVAYNSLFVNRFSVLRLELLEKYYDDMSELMRADENAFLRVQAHWLGRSFEDIDIISDEHPLTVEERAKARSDIETLLSNWLGKEMDEEARKAFCVETKDSLMALLEEINSDEAKQYKKRIYHNELSGSCLEYIVDVFKLPFVLNGRRGHKILEDQLDPNLTPPGDSDLRELRTGGKKASKKRP